jgi:hypothetical protein
VYRPATKTGQELAVSELEQKLIPIKIGDQHALAEVDEKAAQKKKRPTIVHAILSWCRRG